jgi:hypothetical protein
LTSTSSRPKRSSVAATAARQAAGSVRSPMKVSAAAPVAVTLSTMAWVRPASRPAATTA